MINQIIIIWDMHSHTHTLIQEQNMYKHINNIHAYADIQKYIHVHRGKDSEEKQNKWNKMQRNKSKQIKKLKSL